MGTVLQMIILSSLVCGIFELLTLEASDCHNVLSLYDVKLNSLGRERSANRPSPEFKFSSAWPTD